MEDEWQDQAAEQLLAQQSMPDVPYGAPPLGRPPLPSELPEARVVRPPDAMGAQAAPLKQIPAEVYKQFQERMKYFEELKKAGIPPTQLPNMGYEEGKRIPMYKNPYDMYYTQPHLENSMADIIMREQYINPSGIGRDQAITADQENMARAKRNYGQRI